MLLPTVVFPSDGLCSWESNGEHADATVTLAGHSTSTYVQSHSVMFDGYGAVVTCEVNPLT